MAANMRLRLIVRRHGLPEVKLVWPCAASDDLTVANLLTQVNEVVTLESGQWGLEDYAVELADHNGGSFECLHFQQVGKLLKQDDQVVIRSLLTEDLRQRRISGRHQISGDGIHLVDGIPFGRRRGPRDRPALTLPPRKRARIAYNSSQEEEDEEIEDISRLLLEDTPRPDEDEGSDDDQDFNQDDGSGDNEEEDIADDGLEEELQLLQADSETHENDPSGAKGHEGRGRRSREEQVEDHATSSQLLKLEGMAPAALVALRAAFPLTPSSIIEAKLDEHGSNLEATYRDLASANDPDLNYNGMMAIFMEVRFNHVSAPEPALLPETPKASKPLIQVVEDIQAPGQSPANDSITGTADKTSRNTTIDNTNGTPVSGDSSDSDESSSESDEESLPGPAAAKDDDDDDEISSSDESAFDDGQDDSDDSDSFSGFSQSLEANDKEVRSEPNAQDPDSGSSDDSSDDSMQGMSNGDASVKETKASKSFIQNANGELFSRQRSSDEDDSEDVASGSSSESSDSDNSSSVGEANHDFELEKIRSAIKQTLGGSSSSSSDSSESSSESEDDAPQQATSISVEHSSSSSSDSSDNFSDAEMEDSPSSAPPGRALGRKIHPVEVKPATPAPAEQQSNVGRGQGLSKTQKRNARRRLAKEKFRQQEQLKLDPRSATAMPTDANSGDTPGAAEKEPIAKVDLTTDQDTAMEDMSLSQKREELRKAIQDAEVASSGDSSSSASASSSDSSSDSGPEEESSANKDSRLQIEVVETIDFEQPQEHPSATTPGSLANNLLPVDSSSLPVTPQQTNSNDDSARKRTRLDMGAGRRMLFGALGVKNPKNRADEEKLRKDLMKDVRPHQNHRQEICGPTVEPEPDVQPQAGADDDWQGKITYRAVECCYEGMVLSEPLFPFVQRWDPQQQYTSMRKRKRDSQNYEEYYDEDSWYGAQESGSSKKKKNNNKKRASQNQDGHQGDWADEYDANIELNYDDAPVNPEAGGDTQATDLDDLPSLPADPNTLTPLHTDEARVGMVVTWQRLELSKATNWQPQVQWVTGMIVSKDSDKIHLVLAKRDRAKDERIFDEDGKRIYDNFEMPEEEDELEEEYTPDDGHREMFWGDLIDARLLQGEPSPSMLNSPIAESAEGPHVDFFAEQAVSGSQPLAASIHDVDSMQVRADIQEEVMDMENEGDPVQESSSIPSGQNYPFPVISEAIAEEPSNSNGSEDRSQPSTSDKTARDDFQSQHKSSEIVIKDSESLRAQTTGIHDLPLQDSLGERVVATDDDEAMADVGHGSGEDQAAHDTPSVNVTYASSQPDGQKEQTPSIDYALLPVPSSASSLRSGRQPQSDFAEPANNDDDGTPVPESGPSAPSQEEYQPKDEARSRESSSDSFPTLDDIWHTAKTSKTQLSPLKSSQSSALVQKNRMLKAEPIESSQHAGNAGTPDRMKSSRNLFPNATQPEQSPRRSSRRRSQPKPSSFVIPEGSQVITLSSSPVPENFDYAEEDVDENYEVTGSSSLPHGSGWVAKNKPGRGRPRKTNNR